MNIENFLQRYICINYELRMSLTFSYNKKFMCVCVCQMRFSHIYKKRKRDFLIYNLKYLKRRLFSSQISIYDFAENANNLHI